VVDCTQKEVVAALPKLIKLNPVVVKEVFNRLLGVHSKFCVFYVHYGIYTVFRKKHPLLFSCITLRFLA